MDNSTLRRFYLRILSFVYFCAFLSWFPQIKGLYGINGILPIKNLFQNKEIPSNFKSFSEFPTLLWWAPALGFEYDAFLQVLCLVGSLLSALVFFRLGFFGNVDSIIFGILWIFYLSLYSVGQTFSGFQWDILLLEAGFLTIFFAPLWNGKPSPSSSILWLIRWLFFRLMFASGVVKLLSNSPSWWDLTALTYHYETQCIPGPLAWYAHQLPLEIQKFSVVAMFIIEILFPFVIFTPFRFLRYFSAFLQILLQILIIVTGNYNFFNILTIALSASLLDDEFFLVVRNRSIKNINWQFWPSLAILIIYGLICLDVGYLHYYFKWDFASLGRSMKYAVPVSLVSAGVCTVFYNLKDLWTVYQSSSSGFWKSLNGARSLLMIGVTWIIFLSSLYPFTTRIHRESLGKLPTISSELYTQVAEPWSLTSSYGLFASMTTHRDEIIFEGSNDGINWLSYELPYQPGNLHRMPPIVAPHQPRLDWQMWFAALGTYQHNPWLVILVSKLLKGTPAVLQLIEKNPFPKAPPKYIRSQLYAYHFTNFESGKNNTWWIREYKGEYLPTLEKNNADLKRYLQNFPVPKKQANLIHAFELSDISWQSYLVVFIIIIISIVPWLSEQKRSKGKTEKLD